MKFDKVFLATHNNGKIKEFSSLLGPLHIKTLSPLDLPIEQPEETGITFKANAEIKAMQALKTLNIPVLADDSGLCVDILGGKPGIFTARHGGYEKLLAEMNNVPQGSRNAKFVCYLAFCAPNMKTQFFMGESKGVISITPKIGSHGFGYDPVFIPTGSTTSYSEMSPEEKAKISHRKQALDKFLTYIKAQI